MLSGIGPIDHLKQHNIECIADLPVGKNLQVCFKDVGMTLLNQVILKLPMSLNSPISLDNSFHTMKMQTYSFSIRFRQQRLLSSSVVCD